MNKIIFTIFSILLINHSVDGQSLSISWATHLGGSRRDFLNSIKQCPDGGFIVSGNTDSDDHGIIPVAGFPTGDAWVIKLDSSGGALFNKCYGSMGGENANDIITTLDNGFAFVGRADEDGFDVSGVHTGSNRADVWFVKLDSAYNIVWQKCLGGTGEEEGYHLFQTSDSGYVLCAQSESNDGDVSVNYGFPDFWIVKLDAHGFIQWQRPFGSIDADIAYSVGENSSGTIFTGGYVNHGGGLINGYHGTQDAFLLRLDMNGNSLWNRCFGGADYELFYDLFPQDDGTCYLFGYTGSQDGDVVGNTGGVDGWFVKIDSVGTILYQKCLGGQGPDIINKISKSFDGGFYFIGRTGSNDGIVTGNHGSGDIWVCKIDSFGNFICGKCIGGSDLDDGWGICSVSSGGVAVCGWGSSSDGDFPSNYGFEDGWVIRLNETPASSNEIENEIQDLTVFHDIDNLTLRFFSKNSGLYNYRIVDVSGRVILEGKLDVAPGVNYKRITLGYTLPVAGYIFSLYNERGVINKKLF